MGCHVDIFNQWSIAIIVAGGKGKPDETEYYQQFIDSGREKPILMLLPSSKFYNAEPNQLRYSCASLR